MVVCCITVVESEVQTPTCEGSVMILGNHSSNLTSLNSCEDTFMHVALSSLRDKTPVWQIFEHGISTNKMPYMKQILLNLLFYSF